MHRGEDGTLPFVEGCECAPCQFDASCARIYSFFFKPKKQQPVTPRQQVLDGGAAAIADRDTTYSTQGDAFAASAALKAAWRAHNHGRNGASHDEAIEMVLHKVARIATGELKLDNYVDVNGYSALAYEKAMEAGQ